MEKPRKLECTSNHYVRMNRQIEKQHQLHRVSTATSPIWFHQHTGTKQQNTRPVSVKEHTPPEQHRQPSDRDVVLIVNVSMLRQVWIVRPQQLYRSNKS